MSQKIAHAALGAAEVAIRGGNPAAGEIFARKDFSTSIILEAAMTHDGQSIRVMCGKAETDGIKPWSLAKVTFGDGLYVHTSKGTFFGKDGAEKAFRLMRGLKWTDGDTLDDYC
ncbi:MAG: hypothetical protein JNK42_00615 [Caedimonas sp.]|nr:hypothetical protein [Caedimonas sp.]